MLVGARAEHLSLATVALLVHSWVIGAVDRAPRSAEGVAALEHLLAVEAAERGLKSEEVVVAWERLLVAEVGAPVL